MNGDTDPGNLFRWSWRSSEAGSEKRNVRKCLEVVAKPQ
jgi:hypothetical protein